MSDDYSAITDMLRSDSSLTFGMGYAPMSHGISHRRVVIIAEPNPDEGRECGSGDQTYRMGPMRDKAGYTFVSRDALEGLDLLRKACEGEKGLKDTARTDHFTRETIDGFEEPSPGIDGWLYAGFNFSLKPGKDRFIASMTGGTFKPAEVFKGTVNSVDDAIANFEVFPVEQELLHSLYRGCELREHLLDMRNLGILPKAYTERAMFSDEFRDEYEQALNRFGVVQLTDNGKNALLLSMVLGRLCKFKDPISDH